MRAQAAFEYMVIVGLVLAFIVPIWVYVATVQQQTQTELAQTYAETSLKKVANAVDLVYVQGPPAKVNTQIVIPAGISNFSVLGTNLNTLYFRIGFGSTASDVVAVTRTRVNGTIPIQEGTYTISVEANASFVQLRVVE